MPKTSARLLLLLSNSSLQYTCMVHIQWNCFLFFYSYIVRIFNIKLLLELMPPKTDKMYQHLELCCNKRSVHIKFTSIAGANHNKEMFL
jgi:hypothetical protein